MLNEKLLSDYKSLKEYRASLYRDKYKMDKIIGRVLQTISTNCRAFAKEHYQNRITQEEELLKTRINSIDSVELTLLNDYFIREYGRFVNPPLDLDNIVFEIQSEKNLPLYVAYQLYENMLSKGKIKKESFYESNEYEYGKYLENEGFNTQVMYSWYKEVTEELCEMEKMFPLNDDYYGALYNYHLKTNEEWIELIKKALTEENKKEYIVSITAREVVSPFKNIYGIDYADTERQDRVKNKIVYYYTICSSDFNLQRVSTTTLQYPTDLVNSLEPENFLLFDSFSSNISSFLEKETRLSELKGLPQYVLDYLEESIFQEYKNSLNNKLSLSKN